jgi:hypothetical protein
MTVREPQYELAVSRDSVELWSHVRLPFEPTGTMKQARAVLRKGIRSMVLDDGHWLAADYVSAQLTFVDVENVLFYNVGPSVFSALVAHGLTARRVYQEPRVSPTRCEYPHYQRYKIDPVVPLAESDALLTFECPPLTSRTKPHDVWWAASRASVAGTAEVSGRYWLDVQVPGSASLTLAASMKPLLDGVISALHQVHELDHVAIERLSSATRWAESEIVERLRRPAAPILESRCVVRSYREFIKWDPADDMCDGFTLRSSGNDDLCRVWVRGSDV